MKLGSFCTKTDSIPWIGSPFRIDNRDYLVDVTKAFSRTLRTTIDERSRSEIAQALVPTTMVQFLWRGSESLERAQHGVDVIDEATQSGGVGELEAHGIIWAMESVRFLSPVPRPGKIVSVGANYPKHVEEASSVLSSDRRRFPLGFAKFPSSLLAHKEPIPYPSFGDKLDYEGELCVIIGKECSNVSPENYLDVVAGFSIMNDVSLRDIQFEEMSNGVLTMGKNFPGAAPMGPWLVMKEQVAEPENLRIVTRVDGDVRQDDRTSSMIFSLGEIVAYWSRLGLEPGDVISTGTPAGVGIFRDPPEEFLLNVGQTVEIEIEGLGTLQNRVGEGIVRE